MFKTGMIILACFCIALVTTETVGIGILWSRGQLNQRTFREIEVILTSGDEFSELEAEAEQNRPEKSLEEIEDERVIKILGLENRESLNKHRLDDVLKQLSEVTRRQEVLQKDRRAFDAHLKQANEKITDQATELTRGVLLVTRPKDAVLRLMDLTVEQDVILLKGMPEENIANILKEFKGQDEMVERGKAVFKALNRGEPQRTVVDKQLNTIKQESQAAAN